MSSIPTMHFDVELDTRGLLCPLPILKTKFQMDKMTPGQVLRVLSTDAGSLRDMEAYARQTSNRLLSTTQTESEIVFYLAKA